MRQILSISGLICLMMCGCSSTSSAEEQGHAETHSNGTTAQTGPAAIATAAIARELGMEPDALAKLITISSVEAIDFGDSSLGCPQPGMGYLQVITPGHKVMAEHNNKVYDVRVAGGRAVICDERSQQGTAR